MEKLKHGWYSEKQAAIAGTHVYSTDTCEVHVSTISQSATDSGSKFDDIKYVGIVKYWLREGIPRGMGQKSFEDLKKIMKGLLGP